MINPFIYDGLNYPAGRFIDYDPASDFYSGLSDGATIAAPKDISGNANHGAAGDASFLATITRSGSHRPPNGKPTFYFNNDSTGFNIANIYYWTLPDLSALSSGEAFIIYELFHDPTTTNELGAGIWNFGTDTPPNVIPYKDGNDYDDFGSTARKGFGSGGNSGYKNQFLLYSAKSKSGDFQAYKNGTQLYSTATNTVAFSSTPYLGANIAPFMSYFFQGWIARFIFFTPALSDAETVSFSAQLVAKYGL